MKTTEELLQDRHTAMLEWAEPWSGIDSDGNSVLVDVVKRATVDACIRMARYTAIKKYEVPPDDPRLQDDGRLLDEFRIVHWAQVVE